MKRILYITLFAYGILILAGCSSPDAGGTNEGNIDNGSNVPVVTGRSLSEDQTFVVADDAPNGEIVGVVKAYPEYERIGAAPTFSGVMPGTRCRQTACSPSRTTRGCSTQAPTTASMSPCQKPGSTTS